MSTILVVDDQKNICEVLSIILEKEGYDVKTANNGFEALKLIRNQRFDAVLADVVMPRVNGLDILEAVTTERPQTPVIMMTGYASPETAIQAMKMGAFDYVIKGGNDQNDKIKLSLRNAIESSMIKDYEKSNKTYSDPNLIGQSPRFQIALNLIPNAVENNFPVLLEGETGVGKDLFAETIFLRKKRKGEKCFVIDCAIEPNPFLSAENFYARFNSSKQLLELQKGTIYLDKIDDASIGMQRKLLWFLERGELLFEKVFPVKHQGNIIISTTKDLETLVSKNEFLSNLFFRINGFQICLPPLRERKKDIRPLALHFLMENNKKNKSRKKQGFLSDAIRIMESYYWPGNVTELKNVIERSFALDEGPMITSDNLPGYLFVEDSNEILKNYSEIKFPIDLEKTLEEIEKGLLIKAINLSDGIIINAAKKLKLSFRSMRYRIKKHHISES